MNEPSPSDRGGAAPSINPVPPHVRRTQRPRWRGYRTPPGTIYVGRPTMWANPFPADRYGHAHSVLPYRRWLSRELGPRTLRKLGFSLAEIDALIRLRVRVITRAPGLAGRTLQCWCPTSSRWCHADVLAAFVRGLPV